MKFILDFYFTISRKNGNVDLEWSYITKLKLELKLKVFNAMDWAIYVLFQENIKFYNVNQFY